jgi:methylase of polypeptide subunit release factors
MLKLSHQSEASIVGVDSPNLGGESRLSKSFVLQTCKVNSRILISKSLGLQIRIREGGYTPKSGLFIAEDLRELHVGQRALDIGTGETGFLANCLVALGATSVLATDVDPQAIDWARDASNRSGEILWECCDLVPDNLKKGVYDTIVSNPPQMPMPYPGPPHDYGGKDGRDYIERIIQHSQVLLSERGQLILLCFDFLGIEEATGTQTIVEFAERNGLQTQILSRHNRIIRPGGKTEESLPWIEKMYPGYSFQKNSDGSKYHETFILRMSRSIRKI